MVAAAQGAGSNSGFSPNTSKVRFAEGLSLNLGDENKRGALGASAGISHLPDILDLENLSPRSRWGRWKPTEMAPPDIRPTLLPPRSGDRPTSLYRVCSEPGLREEFLGLADRSSSHEGLLGVANSREDLESLGRTLDKQKSLRRANREKSRIRLVAQAKEKKHIESVLKWESLGSKRTPWTYVTDELNYFDLTMDRSPSDAAVQNGFLQGIYTHKGARPPHHMDDNTGWETYHTRNEFNELIGYFRTKRERGLPWGLCKSPGERKFDARLEARLHEALQEDLAETAAFRDGNTKRARILAKMDDHSCHKRGGERPEWRDTEVTNHTYFSVPESYLPGQQEYETGLDEFIMQPARAQARLGMIGGQCGKKWSPPKKPVVGTSRQFEKAEALLRPIASGGSPGQSRLSLSPAGSQRLRSSNSAPSLLPTGRSQHGPAQRFAGDRGQAGIRSTRMPANMVGFQVL